MREFYESNQSFHEYVDKYCTKHKIGREEAFGHAMVKNIADAYKRANKGKISVTEINAGCGAANIDMKNEKKEAQREKLEAEERGY